MGTNSVWQFTPGDLGRVNIVTKLGGRDIGRDRGHGLVGWGTGRWAGDGGPFLTSSSASHTHTLTVVLPAGPRCP